ncbi:PQ-loop domain-containing transporter [Phytohabitans rumicis]|uniref:PQ loop repeat protein n=1 Tax=Phytohabitans rumicis TaxID=1076125 RepID=A0A6V8LJY7_9ACTN|nr:PQ-loop domain-containing transporter [Phytohabitans rumicis]GFJ95188.1 hypothetical protein Prum_088300 [Phytohabitans rumicis]
MEQLLAYLPIVAAAFGIPQYLPQIIKLRSTGDTAGVSWSWATLTSVNNAAWLGYFVLSGYWAAMLPSSAAALLAGAIAVTLARRGSATWPAAAVICGWAVLLVGAYAAFGRAGLGALLTAASIVQVTPSLWTAYRTTHPTGLAYGTWLLILGELSCWLTYGFYRSDPRLIVLGVTGVTAAVLMLTRIWRTRESRLRSMIGTREARRRADACQPADRVPADGA